MKDIVSINRAFLLHAKEVADKSEGSLITGISPDHLRKLKEMSVQEVDQIASALPISAFQLRFDEVEFLKVLESKSSMTASYSVSVLSRPRR